MIFSKRRVYSRALRSQDQSWVMPFRMRRVQASRSGQRARARSMVCQRASAVGSPKQKPVAVPPARERGVASVTVSASPPVDRTIGTVPCARL